MTSLNVVRWGGLAAMLSGMLFVVKGLAILVSDADPSFVPPATLLFALGMVGLHARLRGRGGPLGRIGVLLAWVVVGASVVNLIGLALPIPTPGEPDASILLRITYMVAFLGILIGLLVLGVATLRSRVVPTPFGAVPLAVGVLWFPLQGIGFVIADGVGLILGGSFGPCWGTFSGHRAGNQPSKPRRALGELLRTPLPRNRVNRPEN